MRISVLPVLVSLVFLSGTGAAQAQAVDPYYCSVIHASLLGRVPSLTPRLSGPRAGTQVGPINPVNKQTEFMPYYGKNSIHYDSFNWQVYETEHFSIYYYGDTKQHLSRLASYAESAYQQVSADLRHDLP